MLQNGIDKGGADVPVRIPSRVVPITGARASNETIVAITEPKGNGPQGDASFLPYLFFIRSKANLVHSFYAGGIARVASHPQTP